MQGKMQKIMECFSNSVWLEEDGSHVVSDRKSLKDVSFSSVAFLFSRFSVWLLPPDDIYHLKPTNDYGDLNSKKAED